MGDSVNERILDKLRLTTTCLFRGLGVPGSQKQAIGVSVQENGIKRHKDATMKAKATVFAAKKSLMDRES